MLRPKLTVGAVCAATLAVAAATSPAAAYIGPGLGLGVIASIFGAIAAFFMMLAGLVWYPVKDMLRKGKEKKAAAGPASDAAAGLPDGAQAGQTPQE